MTSASLSTADVSYCVSIFSFYSIPPLFALTLFLHSTSLALQQNLEMVSRSFWQESQTDRMATEPLTQADIYIMHLVT